MQSVKCLVSFVLAVVLCALCACQKGEEEAIVTTTTTTSTMFTTTTLPTSASTTTTTENSTTSTTKATTTTKKVETQKPTTSTTQKTSTISTTTTTKKIKNPEYGTTTTIHPRESGIEFNGWGWKALSTTYTWKVDYGVGRWVSSSTSSMTPEEVREWDQFGLEVMNSFRPTHEGVEGESYRYTVWVWLEKE